MSKSRVANRIKLADDIYKMTFEADECRFSRPGQIVLIGEGDDARPFRVCDYDSNRFTIVFKIRDRFSKALSESEYGTEYETLTGLGNGFDVDAVPEESVLVADAMGVSEMLELSRSLLMRGKKFKVVLGYNTRDEMFMLDSYRVICNNLEVMTLDGSNGREGMASDAVRNADYVCASGSPAMLKALSGKTADGQFSLSEMMAMSQEPHGDFDVALKDGMVRCSLAGPVFNKSNVNWDMISTDRWNRSTY